MMQAPAETFKVPSGDFEILIGSDTSCEFQALHLPKIAAGLKRYGDRLFIKDFGRKPQVTVNGKNIHKKRWVEVTRYDKITVCTSLFNLSPAVFLGRDRVNLDSSELRLILANGKILCDNLYIRAKSGTVTAIMGPSGAGKTVFLNIINGYTTPSAGKILINKKLDLQSYYFNLRDFIGYVPQDDIMIPELTVRQSLNYRICLRYPDMSSSIRKQLIKETCESLGFRGNRLDNFLDTVIGSSESGLRGLSGGEKKRANIAHELVLKPLLLILDEPTSGLSSVDTEYIVKLLKDLSTQSGLTIIATIHQPSRDAYNNFDDLLLIGLGGKVGYYGFAKKAVAYFEETTGSSCIGRNPPEYIMSFFSDAKHCNKMTAQFDQAIDVLRKGSKKYYYIHDSYASLTTKNSGQTTTKNTLKSKSYQTFSKNLRQWFVLLQRNFHVLIKDKVNLFLLFGQVPIIAILMLLAFHKFSYDYKELDKFSRKIYYFDQLKEPLEKQGKSIPVDRLLREATNKAQENQKLISEFGSRYRGAIYFVLVAASIWFGIMGGCKEIVTEQHILKRELRSCVNLKPCLFSKMSMLALLAGCQTAILTAIVSPMLLQLNILFSLKLWIVLWITSTTSAALGLCISCFSPTYRFALTAVPLLLIPQLIFGGLVRPPTNIENATRWPQFIGALTIQRWAFQASLSVDTFGEKGVLKQKVEFNINRTNKRYAELNIIQYTDSSLVKSFFRNKWGDSFFFPLGCLTIFTTIYLYSSFWRLKKKFLL